MQGKFMERVGGRKFTGWILSTIALIVSAVAGVDIPPDTLDTIAVIFGTFVGGNAAEHMAGALKARREAQDDDGPVGGTIDERRARMDAATADLP